MADVWTNILDGFREIFISPSRDFSILWILIPIIFFWFTLEVYFGRYKDEKLGWNSALGYGMSMFWIVIISFKTLFANNFELFKLDKLLFIIFIAVYSIIIIYISFTHTSKEKIFFLFTSPTIIYYLFGIAVLWVNDLLIMTLWVAIDLIILYIIILIFEIILKKLIPAASGSSLSGDAGIGSKELSDKSFGDIGKGMGKI